MNVVVLDLEGVLVPEIWIAFAEAAGIPELRRTTRDEPDYDKLMKYRLKILSDRGVKLADIQSVVSKMKPLDGAREFYSRLKSKTRVVILSDTFEEFANPLMAQLDYPTIFCHNLIVSDSGEITGYKLRLSDQKRVTVETLKKLNFKVIASGDSYNDLSMLRAADKAVLFRPSEKFARENSDLPAAYEYTELALQLEIYMKE